MKSCLLAAESLYPKLTKDVADKTVAAVGDALFADGSSPAAISVRTYVYVRTAK